MSAPAVVTVIHGPNLNLLGTREPDVYGHATLADVDAKLQALGQERGFAVACHQRNGEGAIIDLIHAAGAGIVINPGGYTHTSVAIADALRAFGRPAVEVHLSNIYAREAIRHVSVTGAACQGVIMGLGVNSYVLGLEAVLEMIGSGAERS
ncbi:MAG: type II 3-dehydroquinate dehydratase [Nannocystaceae bacterium]|nr:3-dehydroquinate dehydratase [bacterium]